MDLVISCPRKACLNICHHQWCHHLHIRSPDFMHDPDFNSCNFVLLQVWNFKVCKKSEMRRTFFFVVSAS
jgi:hypothetical protein